MLDSDLYNTFQNCDSMLGHELLEGDEEGTLEGDGALDVGQAGG